MAELSRLERWMNGGPWVDKDLLAFHLQVVNEVGGIVLMARREGKTAGMIEVLPTGGTGETRRGLILKLTVEQEEQETVEALVETAAREARRLRCESLASPAGEEASLLYETLGFRPAGAVHCFAKQASKRDGGDLVTFKLDWGPRPDPPFGFKLAIGDVDDSRYTWFLLRRMEEFHALVGWKGPHPSLWLLRDGEVEALTVDSGLLSLWLSPRAFDSPIFLVKVLMEAERLALLNGAKRIIACTHPSSPLQIEESLRQLGYKLEEETPYLELSL